MTVTAAQQGRMRRPPIAPSGDQIELVLGDQRAVVVEVGGGLRSYEAAGRAILDGYAEDELCPSGRGQVLIPWPNRVQDGSYAFDGRTHQLPLDEPERGNAIHGLVRWAAWTVEAREPQRVVLRHILRPRPGYPFALEIRMEYRLSDDGLTVATTVTNIGPDPCPLGAGAHPYLTLGTMRVDSLSLTVPARAVLTEDERGIPTGRIAVDGSAYDFRRPTAIGSIALDHCFTELDRDEDRVARVVLRGPGGAGELTLWADDAYPYLMVFTGDSLPDVNRRSVAVEPMTCPPNAFRTGESLIRLEPGRRFSATWGIAVRSGG